MTFLNYYVKIILAFIIIIKIIGNTLWSPFYKNGADQLLLLYKHISESKELGTPFKELQQVLPSLSRGQIQALLRELRKDNRIHVVGSTSAARWFKVSMPTENN